MVFGQGCCGEDEEGEGEEEGGGMHFNFFLSLTRVVV